MRATMMLRSGYLDTLRLGCEYAVRNYQRNCACELFGRPANIKGGCDALPFCKATTRRGCCGWRRDTLQLDLKHRFAFRVTPRRNFCERNRSNHYFNSEFISSAA
jgi:hypothetical protein